MTKREKKLIQSDLPTCSCGSREPGLIWILDQERYQCGKCIRQVYTLIDSLWASEGQQNPRSMIEWAELLQKRTKADDERTAPELRERIQAIVKKDAEADATEIVNCGKCGSDRTTSDRIKWEASAEVLIPMSCDECSCFWDAIFVYAGKRQVE